MLFERKPQGFPPSVGVASLRNMEGGWSFTSKKRQFDGDMRQQQPAEKERKMDVPQGRSPLQQSQSRGYPHNKPHDQLRAHQHGQPHGHSQDQLRRINLLNEGEQKQEAVSIFHNPVSSVNRKRTATYEHYFDRHARARPYKRHNDGTALSSSSSLSGPRQSSSSSESDRFVMARMNQNGAPSHDQTQFSMHESQSATRKRRFDEQQANNGNPFSNFRNHDDNDMLEETPRNQNNQFSFGIGGSCYPSPLSSTRSLHLSSPSLRGGVGRHWWQQGHSSPHDAFHQQPKKRQKSAGGFDDEKMSDADTVVESTRCRVQQMQLNFDDRPSRSLPGSNDWRKIIHEESKLRRQRSHQQKQQNMQNSFQHFHNEQQRNECRNTSHDNVQENGYVLPASQPLPRKKQFFGD